MSDITLRLTTPDDTKLITQLMNKYWGGEPLVIRARNYYPSKLNGLIATRASDIAGFLFFDIQESSCEIVVFEVFDKFAGLGTLMLNRLITLVKKTGCERIFLMTSNDNLDALRFYQRRGFHICGIHFDSVKESRKMKPAIPLNGEYGIPLRDEIDLEMLLTEH